MYLSCLEIDTRRTRGRAWLANPYRVHQRLLMAFPDGEHPRLLFRIDGERDQPRIVVQAPIRADWDRAFREHPVLVAPPRQKEITLRLAAGQRLRFLLRANPTKSVAPPPGADGRLGRGKRIGLLREADQRRWLEAKGEAGGFHPIAYDVRSHDLVMIARGVGEEAQTHAMVDFEGYLEVAEPTALLDTLERGIGAGKAFGFGLLSLAPAAGSSPGARSAPVGR